MTGERPGGLSADDEDRLVAAVRLCGRAGAKQFQLGYLHDDVPMAEAGWYAHVQYRGARIIAEDCASPADAADELARRILTGARCKCGKLVALSAGGAFAFHRVVMSDGTTWTAEEAARAGQCRWRRIGPRWVMGCQETAGGSSPDSSAGSSSGASGSDVPSDGA